MARLIRFLVPLVLTVSIPLLADDTKVVFRSEVALARVDAQVLDRSNRAITGLSKSDFVLRDNGQVQEITNFAREDMPVDVLLLLDVSRSMRPHVERISEAAHEALQALGPNDRVAVMVFDRSTRVRMPFRGNRRDIEYGIQQVLNQEDFQGGTDITRGLLDAAAYIGREGRRDARRAVVILTDDQTERGRDEDRVTRAMSNAGAVLSALLAPDAMGSRFPGGRTRRGGSGWPGAGGGGPLGGVIWGRPRPPVMIGGGTKSAGTAEIAQRTGGDSMRVDDASAFETTLERIRQRYALHFNMPQAKAGQDDIEVELASAARRRYPDAEVHFRRVSMTGSGADSGYTTEPTEVITPHSRQSGASVPETDESTDSAGGLKRRRGVNGDRTYGPIIGVDPSESSTATSGSSASSSGRTAQKTSGWPKADETTTQTTNSTTPAATTENQENTQTPAPVEHKGGWRKLKPGEQP